MHHSISSTIYLILLQKVLVLLLLPLLLVPLVSPLKCITSYLITLNSSIFTCILVKCLKLQRGDVSSGTLNFIFLSLSLYRSISDINYIIYLFCLWIWTCCCLHVRVLVWERSYYNRFHYSYLNSRLSQFILLR